MAGLVKITAIIFVHSQNSGDGYFCPFMAVPILDMQTHLSLGLVLGLVLCLGLN